MTARRPFSTISMLFAAVLCGLAAVPAQAEKKEPRIALVFGNSAYKSSPLRNPSNDAKLVAKSLRAVGFDVILKTDATRRAMRRAMIDFGHRLKDGGVGLFYYAGHGISVRGENYLIPVDAEIEVEDHVQVESVALNQILARMGGARNRLNIVILDACRNNPFARSFRSAASGLSQTLAPSGTYIAYATAPGEVAEDGEGNDSIYSMALARAMEAPGVKIEDVFKDVRRRVSGETKGRQVPWTSSSITGDFFFKPKPKETPKQVAALPPPKPAGPTKETLELAFWESIKDSRSPSDFEAYLGQFPRGVFAGLARSKIAALKQEKERTQSRALQKAEEKTRLLAQTEEQKHLAFWESVKNSRNPSDFEAYLRQYPNGTFAGLARSRIAALQKEQKEQATTKARQERQTERQKHLAFWQSIRESRNPSDFEVYLRQFPNGTFAGLARGRLAALRRMRENAPNGGGRQVAALAPQPAPDRSAELAKLLLGKRIRFQRGRDDREIELWMSKEAEAQFYVANRMGTDMMHRDTGKWWVEQGNRLCFKFDRGLRGNKVCVFIANKDGKLAVDGTNRPWTIR